MPVVEGEGCRHVYMDVDVCVWERGVRCACCGGERGVRCACCGGERGVGMWTWTWTCVCACVRVWCRC